MSQESVQAAMDELLRAINSTTDDDTANGIATALFREHRTIQQSFMRGFVKAMDIYKDSGSDGRNEQAIQLAKEISGTEIILPYI